MTLYKLTKKLTNLSPNAKTTKLDVLNKSKARLQKTGDLMVESVIDQVMDKLASYAVIPEPVLLASLISLATAGGDMAYKNNWSITEMLKKDYKMIIEWAVKYYKYSVVSGKQAGTLSRAAALGATNCALYVYHEKSKLNGPNWTQANRYKEIKKIIVGGKLNFSKSAILNELSSGNMQYSGFGETGNEEFGKKFAFTVGEVNRFLPEKRSPINKQIWETYPKTVAHVDLMKSMLNSSSTPMVHKVIRKRLYDNIVILNPVMSIATKAVGDWLKETGIDKIINAVQTKEKLIYEYLKMLKTEKLL
jgi:hypothetical protein